MGMNWLKGVVGASDRMIPAGQQPPPAWTPYNPQAAPATGAGYVPPQPFGAPPGYAVPPSPYATPPAAPPIGGGPPVGGAAPPSPAAFTPPTPYAAPGPPALPPDARVAALEAQCAELRHDIESIAIFARTLLTLLEEKQITTPEQFAETRKKIEATKPPAA
jgi:hypothetical protein